MNTYLSAASPCDLNKTILSLAPHSYNRAVAKGTPEVGHHGTTINGRDFGVNRVLMR